MLHFFFCYELMYTYYFFPGLLSKDPPSPSSWWSFQMLRNDRYNAFAMLTGPTV